MAALKRVATGTACAVSAIIAIVVSNGAVRTSEKGLELIGNAEACRRDPYVCPAGVLTDGIGNTHGVKAGVIKTDAQIVGTVQTIVRPIIAAQVLVQQSINQLEAAANDITSLGGLVPGNPISKTISNLLQQADLTTRTPALYQLQNVLGRLNKNVTSGQTADGVRSITLSGGNLYQVASDQYGDPSLWNSTASANITTYSSGNHSDIVSLVTTALQTYIASLSLGQLLPFTQLATVAYGASPLVTNISG